MNSPFFCPRWGQEHMPWKELLQHVKVAGCQGVEVSLLLQANEKEVTLNEIAEQGLQFIGQHWQMVCSEFEQHHSEFENRLQALAAVQALFINSQTGKDFLPQ